MNRRFKQHILLSLILLLTSALSLQAQQDIVRVLPELEKNSILIGEQTVLKVSIVYEQSQSVRLVLPEHELVPGVEIVSSSLSDSTKVSDKINKLIYDVVITSFDSAQYTLDNIKALVGDSVYVAQTAPELVVNTVPVDVANPDKYNDIKENWKPKFVLWDYWPWLLALLLVLLAIVAFFLYKKYKDKWFPAKATDPSRPAEPLIDPYTEAIQAIEALRERNLWEKNQVKEYYTELTDILRRYLYRAYGVQTAEKTSSEILDLYKEHVRDTEGVDRLRHIFTIADLAKFAKYAPGPDENVSVLTGAAAFVQESNEQQERERQRAQAEAATKAAVQKRAKENKGKTTTPASATMDEGKERKEGRS